jgi:hypothetical protein
MKKSKLLLAPAIVLALFVASILPSFSASPTTKHSNVATATAGAATLNATSGTITSEALVTAAGADYTLTLTNSLATTTSFVFCGVYNGTNSAGAPTVSTSTAAAGSVVIKIHNSAAAAFNGTIKIFYVFL